MKERLKYLGASIILILIFTISSIATDNGGNGEVLHHSFAGGKKKVKKVLENIYGKKDFIVRVVTKAIKAVGARGEDSYVPIREINTTNKDRFIIHANISEAKRPVKCNISTAKIKQDNKFVTLDIDVKDIKDSVILYNQEDKVIMEYKVEK